MRGAQWRSTAACLDLSYMLGSECLLTGQAIDRRGGEAADVRARPAAVVATTAPSFAPQFAMSMVPPHDRRHMADWAAALEEENARRAATEAWWTKRKQRAERRAVAEYEANLL